MTYQEAYDKLMKHSERFDKWAPTALALKMGMVKSHPSNGKGKGKNA